MGKQRHIDFNHPEFLQSIKRREVSHWAQLYEHTQAKLDAFLRKQLPACDADIIEDCVTEVFSRAYAEIQSFQGQSSLQSWLMSLARGVVMDALKTVSK